MTVGHWVFQLAVSGRDRTMGGRVYGVGFLNVLCMYPHAPNEHNYYLCHNIEAMATAFAAIILKEAKKTCSDY